MGTNIKDLLKYNEIGFSDLNNKKLAVDSFNILYQFLSTIRQRDGSLLKDSNGNVTSHLTGLFSRTTRLMKYGINLAFVFDGKAPELKLKERERRMKLKEAAGLEYNKAKEEGDEELMKKYASRTSKLTSDMINESKKLLLALGCPVVQAESEGEAQVAYIVNKGDCYAGVSEDYDSLLYGIPNLVKNLAISGRKKRGSTYVSVKPKIINFSENMNNLGIDKDKLIMFAMLVGTDYNPGGIKGIGPKNALKLVKEYGDDPEKLFLKVKWEENCDISWNEIFYLFKKMKVKESYSLDWKDIDVEEIKKILVDNHDFSEERVDSSIKDLVKERSKKSQTGLGDWI